MIDPTHFQIRNVQGRDDIMRFDLFISVDGKTFDRAGKLTMPINEYFDFLAVLAKGSCGRCTLQRKNKLIQKIKGVVTP